jgi:hypothetical protein
VSGPAFKIGPKIRLVDESYHKDKAAEKVINETLAAARFRVDGKGCYTLREAGVEIAFQRVIFGREVTTELINPEPE